MTEMVEFDRMKMTRNGLIKTLFEHLTQPNLLFWVILIQSSYFGHVNIPRFGMRRKIFLLKLNFWNDFHCYIKRGIVFKALSTLVNKIAIMLVIRQTNNRHLKNINFVLFSLHLTEKDAQKVGFARKWCAEHPFAVLVKTLRLVVICPCPVLSV